MTVRFMRVKRGGGHDSRTWFVDIGRDVPLLRWWKRRHWDRYVTTDDGNTWATMEESYGGWWPSFMVDPSDMKTIDVLLGVLAPYLTAAGKTSQAVALRERQEEYWKRQERLRERVEAAMSETQDSIRRGARVTDHRFKI